MSELPDKTVFVTGATSGIGEATARRFAAAGAKVVIAGRRRERLDVLAAELGDHCHALTLDVGNGAAVATAISALPPNFAAISVLVNNAGVALGNGPAHEARLADWERIVATNVMGVLNCTHAILPGMVARNEGDIINLGSIAGAAPYPNGAVYGASKAFVHQFTLGLRADLLGRNVRVCCIEPGVIATEFAYVRMQDEAAAREFYDKPNLLQPDDIAELIVHAVALPRRVNLDTMRVMPLAQAYGYPPIADGMVPT
jgi:NADP-dependent 3-hydroxy acid dehydrogenase YdfG